MKIEIHGLPDLEGLERSCFDCGVPALSNWFVAQAGQAQEKRLATVWVAVEPDDENTPLGYYSLSPFQIAYENCPALLKKQLPKYPVAVALLGRLAVARSHQGKGIGELLLLDAMGRTWRTSSQIPVRGLLVHAKDETAASFYRQYDFVAFEEQPLHLFLPMRTLEMLGMG